MANRVAGICIGHLEGCAVMSMENDSNLLRTFAVSCLLLILWGMTVLGPGTGVQHRLNVGKGYDDPSFVASIRQATSKMSGAQIEAFEWAIGQLDAHAFVARYGASPAVRDVVVGEVVRFVDANRKSIASIEARLRGMDEQIRESERVRLATLELLKTYVPVITRIEAANMTAGDSPERSANRQCGELANMETDSVGAGVRIWYRLENPHGISLKSLPCRLSYRVGKGARAYEMEFDCLSRQRRGEALEFCVRPPWMRWIYSGDISVSMIAIHENATIARPGNPGHEASAVSDTVPELAELRRYRRQMKQVLDYKTTM